MAISQIWYKRYIQSNNNRDEINPLSVPFEWFLKEESSEAVLLLWLNNDAFQLNPLQKLSHLAHLIREEAKSYHA